jgi:hypothetical protein
MKKPLVQALKNPLPLLVARLLKRGFPRGNFDVEKIYKSSDRPWHGFQPDHG